MGYPNLFFTTVVEIKLKFSGLSAFARIKNTYLRRSAVSPFYCTFRNRALIATTTVLSDISTAPTAGLNTIPAQAKTPAANGIATML